MMDSADPLDGWDLGYVLQSSYGSAINDMYGKLFNHLRDLLSSFIRQTALRRIAFELFNMDVKDLPKQLGSRQFARIEVWSKECAGDTLLINFYRSLTYLTVAISELLRHSACSVHSYKSAPTIPTQQ